MRPAQQISAPDVWIVREQACFQTLEAALTKEHPNLVLRTATVFAEANPIRSFF
jgi:hypothetical protein